MFFYLLVAQATSGGGGWPMSVWLTPDLKPFIGGTYFPPRDMGRTPGLRTVLLRIIEQVRLKSSFILEFNYMIILLFDKYIILAFLRMFHMQK